MMNSGPRMKKKPKRKPQKGPGRPAAGESLTPQEVAEAAVQLILAEGEAALTMRRLGEMLGVKAMALYNHFPNKDAILDAVTGLAMSRISVPPTEGAWEDRIREIARAMRRLALEQPNLFRVAMTRPSPPSTAFPQIEATLSALADAGLAPEAQAVAYHTLRLYVRAYCLWEIEELGRGGDSPELARLATSYPYAAAAAHLIFTPDTDRQFEAGLDLILCGLKTGK
jgi:TetR/AcrR family transcriptional regulator, tetracycline repressor protein